MGGAVVIRGKRKIQEKYIRKMWGGRDRLTVLRIRDNILGVEGSMSEVVIPPPHHSEKPHSPVAGNNQPIGSYVYITNGCHFPLSFTQSIFCHP